MDSEQLEKLEAEISSLPPSQSPAAKSATIVSQVKNLNDKLYSVAENSLPAAIKAHLYFLRAKLNWFEDTKSKNVEAYLSKAIKLNPKHVESWEMLAEFQYSSGAFQQAFDTLKVAMESTSETPNKILVRKASIAQRRLGTSFEEKKKNTQESLEFAKRAVALDVADGNSWYVLGNAYLSWFFINPSLSQNVDELKRALVAYDKAEGTVTGDSKLDWNFNRSVVYFYLERYQDAVDGFTAALRLDPQWKEPQAQIQRIIQLVTKVELLITKKGQLQSKRLQKLVSSIPYKIVDHESVVHTSISLSDLLPGVNKGKVFIGKIVGFASEEKAIPQIVCAVDRKSNFVAISFYNIMRESLAFGHDVAVIDPQLSTVSLKLDNRTVTYPKISVESINSVRLNGKSIQLSHVAVPELSVSTS